MTFDEEQIRKAADTLKYRRLHERRSVDMKSCEYTLSFTQEEDRIRITSNDKTVMLLDYVGLLAFRHVLYMVYLDPPINTELTAEFTDALAEESK